MNGVIAFSNRTTGRYALRADDGRFTIFQMLSERVGLNIGETVSGDLESIGIQTLASGEHGEINVFVERTHCLSAFASAWVGHRVEFQRGNRRHSVPHFGA